MTGLDHPILNSRSVVRLCETDADRRRFACVLSYKKESGFLDEDAHTVVEWLIENDIEIRYVPYVRVFTEWERRDALAFADGVIDYGEWLRQGVNRLRQCRAIDFQLLFSSENDAVAFRMRFR